MTHAGRKRCFAVKGGPDALLWQANPAPRTVRSSERGRLPGRPRGLEGGDVVLVGQRDADVVEPLEEAPPRVVVDGERCGECLCGDRPLLQVIDDLRVVVGSDELPKLLDDV